MRHEEMIRTFEPHMLAQLYANDHRNGSDGQYRGYRGVNSCNPLGLEAMMHELTMNVIKLQRVILGEHGDPNVAPTPFETSQEQVAETLAAAADVANMAMLLCVDCGALRRTPLNDPKVDSEFQARARAHFGLVPTITPSDPVEHDKRLQELQG